MEKKCNKCNVVKDVSEFGKDNRSKSGTENRCYLCKNANSKKYYEANKEKVKETVKQYQEVNKEKIKQYSEEYQKANKKKLNKVSREYGQVNKEKIAKRKAEYSKDNRENILRRRREYEKSRRDTDNLFKLRHNTASRVRKYLKNGKSKRTREIIGIDFKEFQIYLGKEYKEGTHLDHIIPVSWANNDEEVYTLNHYSNFQIITAEENMAKSDSYCKSENLKKVLDNHNNITKLNQIIERNSDKIK